MAFSEFQRANLIREENAETKENSLAKQNNNSLALKESQALLAPPQEVTQLVKDQPAMQETKVQSLGWEDPLEEDMATYSSILTWRIPWTVACLALLSREFSRQAYWSRLSFPLSGDLPNPGIEP